MGENNWSGFFQDLTKAYVGARVDAKYRQPYDIAQLRLKALGEAGYYEEGKANGIAPKQIIPGISNAVLLIGGLVILGVVLVKS